MPLPPLLPPPLPPAGLVSDCPLEDYVPASCSPVTTDNDGLWTSLLVAAEAFRYQVTRDPQAQANSWGLFKGMEFLVNVSSRHGGWQWSFLRVRRGLGLNFGKNFLFLVP